MIFLELASEENKTYQDLVDEKKSKEIEENKQKRQKQFLKRRSNLKYDPVKAIEEDKFKRQILESQRDIASDN